LLAVEKCSHTCLHATKRKITRKRTDPFSAKKGGYVGMEQILAALALTSHTKNSFFEPFMTVDIKDQVI